jgi:hypothetical protein
MKRLLLALSLVSAPVVLTVFACNSGGGGSTFDSGPGDTGTPPEFDAGQFGSDSGNSRYPGYEPSAITCFETNKNAASCKACCNTAYTAGRKVFTSALDRCACQPSKCYSLCQASYCAVPQQPIPNDSTGQACTNCAQTAFADDAGNATPHVDGGGDYPEMGVAACAVYAANECLSNNECQSNDKCRLGCDTVVLGDGG